MAKILLGISGLHGITNASLEVIRVLELAKHEVLLVIPQYEEVTSVPHHLNFKPLPALAFNPSPPLPKISGRLRKLRLLGHLLFNWRKRQASALQASRPTEFLLTIEAFRPDLLLLDIELHEYIISAYSYKIPIVLLSQWFSLWQLPGLPPIQSMLVPEPIGHATQAELTALWARIRRKRAEIFRRKRWRSLGCDRRSTLLRLAREVGFPLTWVQDNFWPGPITYDQLPVISLAPAALEFPHAARPALTYVGPVVSQARKDLPHLHRSAIEQIINMAENEGRRLIYCSVSTMQLGDSQFINKVIAAVTDQPEWILIISLGGKNLPNLMTSPPSNVYIFDYVPQLLVLAAADCAISHGGIHTINECLIYQVPMLIYSGEKADQNGCTARIFYHSVGLIGQKDKDQATDIRQKLEQLLSNSSFRVRLAKIPIDGVNQIPVILERYITTS